MERKIGLIFKCKGEWYQCLKAVNVCIDCDGYGVPFNDFCAKFGRCEGIIFKKLHKTGKPFSDRYPDGRVIQFQRYECYQKPIIDEDIIWHWVDDNLIDIEIKQNKEDMEEKKLNLKPFDLQKAREGKPALQRRVRKGDCWGEEGGHCIV